VTCQGFGKGTQTAGGVEGFVLHALQREGLVAFQRWQFDAFSVHDGLAGMNVLVDEPIHGPGEVVLQRIGGILRQGAHPHVQPFQFVEALR